MVDASSMTAISITVATFVDIHARDVRIDTTCFVADVADTRVSAVNVNA